jgi:hypothetical protein
VPFTRETLREWGAFFDNSVTLINCSIGEPFMMKNLDELLEIFGRTGKALQMTTNGQILTERNIQKLLGLPIDLYVSLDAATPEMYARLRNNTFEKLLNNLRRLIAAKGGRGRMPYVHLVFMPMRCNLHELEDFVRLAADLEIDRLVLRPLNYSDSTTLDWERAGYRFDYRNELLPFDELVRASGRAARLSRRLGVELADQMDFGGSMRDLFQETYDAEAVRQPTSDDERQPPDADRQPRTTFDSAPDDERPPRTTFDSAPDDERPPQTTLDSAPDDELSRRTTFDSAPDDELAPRTTLDSAPDDEPLPALPSLGGERTPACTEPWKSLYILRRGVLPCCYGGEPLAPMEEYRQTWNSPELQAIRRELLAGRFHSYCMRSPACPIVRKLEQANLLPLRQQALLRGQHVWLRFNRVVNDLPNRYFLFPIKRTGLRIHRAFTQPGYVAKHSRRLLGKYLGL